MINKNAVQSRLVVLLLARDREPGHFVVGDKVVMVKVKGLNPFTFTGYIREPSDSHNFDRKKQVIVYGDQPINRCDPKNKHQKVFDITSHELLKLDEAIELKNFITALDWFKGIYTPTVVASIARHLGFVAFDQAFVHVVELNGKQITGHNISRDVDSFPRANTKPFLNLKTNGIFVRQPRQVSRR